MADIAPPDRSTGRPLRFVVVGAWNTVFGLAVTLAFTAAAEWLGGSWRWALLPAQVVAALNAFWCHHRFVFPDAPADLATFLRYNANSAGMILVAAAEMYLLIDRLGLPSWLVQTAIVPANLALAYALHRTVTFRVPRPPTDRSG